LQPSVLLLDEPFVSLNEELRDTIRMYIQELTLATLLVTHDLEEVESIADSVMKLEN
jgi:ABC-type sulfate/molybdate transport systems ATPase subunit